MLPFELTDAAVDVAGFLICHTLTSGMGAGTFLGKASAGFSVMVGSWGFVSVVELTMVFVSSSVYVNTGFFLQGYLFIGFFF